MDAPAPTPETPPVVAAHAARSPSRRPMFIVGGAILALVVVAVVVVLLGNRGAATYPAGSPEAAFQAYLVAWDADDAETAYAAFSPEVRSDTTLAEYRTMVAEYGPGSDSGQRVVLEGSRVEGDRATLDIRVDYPGGGGLFGGGTWSEQYRIALVREDGAWLIAEPLLGVMPQPWWKY